MFHRKPITLSVSMALAAMGAVTTAQADTLFFPHVVNSDTVTTVVSVVNTGENLWNSSGINSGTEYDRLHWRLFFKNAGNNADPCIEYNKYLPTSYYDLQTVDLGAAQGPGVLFEPGFGQSNVKWDQPGVNYNMLAQARDQLSGAAVRGFLLIDNPEKSDSPFGTLYGEAIVIEFSNGASWGYQAYSQGGNEYDYEAYGAISGYPLTLLPFIGGDQQTATTAFMVTPLIDDRAPRGQSWADSEMDLAFDYKATLSWGDGLWDRDENWISSGRKQSVTCVGRIDATALLPGAVPPAGLENGGFGPLYNWTDYTYVRTITEANGQTWTQTQMAEQEHVAVIFKLEYGSAFDGVDLGGVYNNAFPVHPAGCGESWSAHCVR